MSQGDEKARDGRIEPPAHNTQINFLFPPSTVELPSADQFKGFPEEAQKAILAAFQLEQQSRHQWVLTQQKNDHELNLRRQRDAFWLRVVGLVTSVLLVVCVLAFGVWLIQIGATAGGVALIVTSLTALVGAAVYGVKARASAAQVDSEGTTQGTARPAISEKTSR